VIAGVCGERCRLVRSNQAISSVEERQVEQAEPLTWSRGRRWSDLGGQERRGRRAVPGVREADRALWAIGRRATKLNRLLEAKPRVRGGIRQRPSARAEHRAHANGRAPVPSCRVPHHQAGDHSPPPYQRRRPARRLHRRASRRGVRGRWPPGLARVDGRRARGEHRVGGSLRKVRLIRARRRPSLRPSRRSSSAYCSGSCDASYERHGSEKVVNLARQHAPDGPIAFNSSPEDCADAALRWLRYLWTQARWFW
jgi:hypothetical protein